MTNEIFKNTYTDKEKVLAVWQFFNNNRIHYDPPSWDAYINYNMLTCYGYGPCDVTAWDTRLLLKDIGFSSNSCYMVHHTVSDIHTSKSNILLDSDLKVFYLNYDNSTLSGYNDVI